MPDMIQKEIMKANPILTDLMWRSMKNEFRVLNRNLLKTNAYFAEHVYDIAEENARGQVSERCYSAHLMADMIRHYLNFMLSMH